METYIIEDNIDFYSELHSNCEEETNQNIITTQTTIYNDENMCLITHSPLIEHHQVLPCGHSFNYLPLYKYTKNAKLKFNHLELPMLTLNQIKCPFCRTIHNQLLPYIQLPGVFKINGVNAITILPNGIQGICSHITSHGKPCMNTWVYKQTQPPTNTTTTTTTENGIYYCITHRIKMIKLQQQQQTTNISVAVTDNLDELNNNIVNNTNTTTTTCTYMFKKGKHKDALCSKKHCTKHNPSKKTILS